MPSDFPTFQVPHLYSFYVCSCFSLSDSPLSTIVKQVGDKTETRETRFESARGPAWIRIRVDRLDRNREREGSKSPAGYDGRFRVDCSLQEMFRPSREKKTPPNSQDEVRQLLEMFAAEKPGKLCCEGFFRVPKEVLPKRGIVESMLDVSAKVASAEMILNGASFDIRERRPYERLRWRLPPETARGLELEVDIAACDDLDSIGGHMEKITEILGRGVQELVLEVTPEGGA